MGRVVFVGMPVLDQYKYLSKLIRAKDFKTRPSDSIASKSCLQHKLVAFSRPSCINCATDSFHRVFYVRL
ncbi:hypothetical protein CPT_Slocum_082 [Serratia phage Slocum]|nr:hypothetical protein CPT_Slocum_082 [Serratia phage Slocum]